MVSQYGIKVNFWGSEKIVNIYVLKYENLNHPAIDQFCGWMNITPRRMGLLIRGKYTFSYICAYIGGKQRTSR